MLHDMIDQASYMAHGYCLLWKPWLVTLHAGSDLLIFAAYSAIPVAIWIFVSRRPNVEMRWLARMFAAFILWCGVTHLVNLITLWYPIYEFQGAVKLITATVSVTTAVAIFPLIPKALAIPSPNELRFANAQLEAEIDAHRRTLEQLKRSRDELEQRVQSRTRELDEMSTRFRLLFERAPVAMLMADRGGQIRQANTAAATLFGYEVDRLEGEQIERLIPERFRAGHADLRKDFMSQPEARPMGLGRDLYARQKDGREIPVEIGLNPLVADGETFVVASVINISERRQREEQIKMLMREVNHRSKNMLGVVQSIARLTANTDPVDFAQRFSQRVRALGASQDLLINSDWRGAELIDLVNAQLAHYEDLLGSRIIVEGPAVRLGAAAAQTIGLAIHELSTNAGKYGALSSDDGKVSVEWRLIDRDGQALLSFEWIETGGPAVSVPKGRGFGMTVLGPMVKLGLEAEVTLDFEPRGIHWRMVCPAGKVAEESSPGVH